MIRLPKDGENVKQYIIDDLIPVIVSVMDEVSKIKATDNGQRVFLEKTVLEDRVEELEQEVEKWERVHEENMKHITVLQEENTLLRQGDPITYHVSNRPDGDI